jgi:preprotein translocase subunit SecD
MERSWWWKSAFFLVITAVSVLYLIPTVTPEAKQPEFVKKHLQKKIQLGLDLQGGLHLVYEVAVNKAVSDKADRTATDIEDKLHTDKKIKNVRVDREGDKDIVVRLTDPADLAKLDRQFVIEYRDQLDEVSRDPAKGEVRYTIAKDYIDKIKDDSIRQAIETIRGRVDQFGVSEPSIVKKGDNIVIELPGLKESDFERIKNIIGRTAQLEFKIVDDTDAANDYIKSIAPLAPKGIEFKPTSWPEKDSNREHNLYFFEAKTRQELEKFVASLPKDKLPPPQDEFGFEEINPRSSGDEDNPKPTADKYWHIYLMSRRAQMTGEYVSEASVGWDQQTGRPEVEVEFDREGAGIIERVSSANIGRKMATILDNTIKSAPVIESKLGKRIRITLGSYGDPTALQEEAKDLVSVLKSGALPAPLRKTFETKVGPTLGKDAINKAKFSMTVGSLAVILFMLIYYRKAGFIADVAMALNILYMVAIMAGFEATLTLPGIAGLVLTVGMAVDANIIIYERIREELRGGKSPRAAVDAGFARAFWTVFDAHVTNFVAGVVLYSYGTGPIRGFAVTLLVGIVTNLFTSIWVSRGMFSLLVDRKKPAQLLSI